MDGPETYDTYDANGHGQASTTVTSHLLSLTTNDNPDDLREAISDAKAFIDIHGEAKQSAEGKPLEEIDGLRSQLSRAIGRSAKASELKIEAMLVQAYKSSIKATQRDLVTAQLAAIAGADDLQESCIQPSLLAWGKGVLG